MSAVPVVVATARDDDASVVRALDAGADNYITTKQWQNAESPALVRQVSVLISLHAPRTQAVAT